MIISFPDGHFGRNTQRPLSRLMVASLQLMCAKQKAKIPLNFKDGHGAFTALVTRGLIVSKDIISNGQRETIWEVTDEAIDMLKDLGINVSS
jgi:hypothetical protein